jgi:hypothetical protein
MAGITHQRDLAIGVLLVTMHIGGIAPRYIANIVTTASSAVISADVEGDRRVFSSGLTDPSRMRTDAVSLPRIRKATNAAVAPSPQRPALFVLRLVFRLWVARYIPISTN